LQPPSIFQLGRPPAGEQANVQYQVAVLIAARDAIPALNFPLANGTNSVPTSPVFAPNDKRFANMTEVVGMETAGLATSFVSNSGVHYGYRQEVAIEAQPLFRGSF
jgi:hypothetical protein